jgi:isocitrate/isopropylmalate dehydrogenase
VVRENTEGEYSGLEHEVVPGVVGSLKVITRAASIRIAESAFYYAATQNRRKVSAIHKANIMKRSDGLFLNCYREVAKKYPQVHYEEVIVDNCCMQLVELSACMMLRHLGEIDLAGASSRPATDVIASKQHVTFDLGGTATTSEFAQAISSQL